MSDQPLDLKAGDLVVWRAVVSNYGHVQNIPACVVSIGARRVRIETRFRDGVAERRMNVKRANLRRADE